MFETNADLGLDVDDEFLNGAFDYEQENITNAFTPRVENHVSFTLSQAQTKCQIKFMAEDVSSINHLKPHGNLAGAFGSGSIQVHSGNKDNKRKYEPSRATERPKRERKFPGPAGLLPDRKLSCGTPIKLDSIIEAERSSPTTTPDDLCSQGRCSGSVLEEEPWQCLLSDLGPDRKILDVVNVASVKRKAAARCFVGRKVPFLAAVLHHLDVSSPDPCVILRDTSGEIHGTLHRDVWDQFAGELIVGSVLVVRNVGLLSTGISSRRHYLNITANNLVTIYSAHTDKSRKTRFHLFTTQDFVQTIENWHTLTAPSHAVGSPSSLTGSLGLFSSSSNLMPESSNISSPRNTNSSSNFNASKRPFSNKNNVHHKQGLSVKTSQNEHCINIVTSTPGNSHRPKTGNNVSSKNLFPSFSLGSDQGFSNLKHVTSNLAGKSKPFSSLDCNSFVSSPPSLKSFQQVKYPNKVSVTTTQVGIYSPSEFKFDPVILKPRRFSDESFPKSNSEREMNSLSTATKAPDAKHLSSVVVLSQSSQLSAEEQSVIESVFDGVDADSLFDDDF